MFHKEKPEKQVAEADIEEVEVVVLYFMNIPKRVNMCIPVRLKSMEDAIQRL